MIVLGVAMAAPWVRTERIDLLSEDAGSLLWEEVPRVGVAPRTAALRWLEQVRFVATIPRYDLVLGASVTSQSISARFQVNDSRLYGSAGITTRLGLPRGVLVGGEVWAGPVRLGLGLHLSSDASWTNLRWNRWRAIPGLGIGIGRRPKVF